MSPNLLDFLVAGYINSYWGWWVGMVLVLLCGVWGGTHLIAGSRLRKRVQQKFKSSISRKKKPIETHDEIVSTDSGVRSLYYQAGMKYPFQFWMGSVILAAGSVLFLFSISGKWAFGVGGASMVIGASMFFLVNRVRTQKVLLVEQLPLFLQTLSNTLQAGYSLSHSFQFVAREIEPPLYPHIQKMNDLLAIQIPTERVLKLFQESIDHPEIDFFTESTIIQLNTGGDLVQLFQKISDLIEEKLKLQRDIKSFTSQGKMSGILIVALWPISLLLFRWIAPNHVGVLFDTGIGNFLLFFSIILEIIGFVMIWRLIQVKI